MRRRVSKCSWNRMLICRQGILDPEDRISCLPDGVLHHIKSFLPSSNRNQARFLSRKWRQLHGQSLKRLSLTRCRLNADRFTKILQEDFHSVEHLTLIRCSGMNKLKLMSYKMKGIKLNYCRGLKSLELTTPFLRIMHFNGYRLSPCRIDLGICKELMDLRLVSVDLNYMMFKDCDSSFPILTKLTISCCDMPDCMNIASNSLRQLSLLKFKKNVEIIIDAPILKSFRYTGSTIVTFSNMSLPALISAWINLKSKRYQNLGEMWFRRLVGMLKGLKHAQTLTLETNSDKNIIVPEELRPALVPPLDGNESMEIMAITATPNNETSKFVELIDTMLWLSPRARNLELHSYSNYWLDLWLVHDTAERVEGRCGFCFSHTSRCWRHSVREYKLVHSPTLLREEFVMYFTENTRKVRRNVVERLFLD